MKIKILDLFKILQLNQYGFEIIINIKIFSLDILRSLDLDDGM